MRINGLLRIMFALLLVATFALFMTGCPWDDEDDEASCTDAATNAIDVYIGEGNDKNDICDALDGEILSWVPEDLAECVAKEYPDELRSFAISELSNWCKEDDWSQSVIDCVAEGDTVAELDNCD